MTVALRVSTALDRADGDGVPIDHCWASGLAPLSLIGVFEDPDKVIEVLRQRSLNPIHRKG